MLNFLFSRFSLPGKYDLHLSQVSLINIHKEDKQTKQVEKRRKIKKTQPRRRVREEEKSK